MPNGLARQRIYNLAEVEHILRDSEGRGGGHSFERHVGIPNHPSSEAPAPRGSLEGRGDAAARRTPDDGVIRAMTAFSSNADEFQAVMEVLNSAVGQAALGHLDHTVHTGLRVTIQAIVPTDFTIRYASGSIVRHATVDMACVVAERIEEACCHGVHIQTCFPLLSLNNQGHPGWREGNGPWQP